MQKYILHYAPVNLKGDIPESSYSNFQSLVTQIDATILNRQFRKPLVYLLAMEIEGENYEEKANGEILVTRYSDMVGRFLTLLHDYCFEKSNLTINFFLQEYTSFEDAYKVALDMRENSPLCYS